MPFTRSFRLWLVLPTSLFLLLAPVASAVVTIDWVTVGGAGNACDVQAVGCFGAVATTYRISKTEVTNGQYVEFLNAKAASDPNGLYSTSMGPGGSGFGGITRSGSPGSYTYAWIAGRRNWPVNYVSFYDSLRFANWLNNGQGSGDTETGTYTITATGITNNSITRNTGANVFLTSEDEWYKAAYYDVVTASYFDYPAGSDVPPGCTAPGAVANTANCLNVVGNVIGVGRYTGSASPNGTFDQGGNAWEWNEAVELTVERVQRGGSFLTSTDNLAAFLRGGGDPSIGNLSIGFRVASPAPGLPSVPSLSPPGIAMLCSLLGLASLCRRHA
ncbi:MAG: SUMF1/EgtB/PvdO family nonheme iron enzyme [Deltaproteobacteria bacterium]|nr:SUMF1/EgtB/PvdO family nonheme iron enzyme [Deltaproteobacteria bacterium]